MNDTIRPANGQAQFLPVPLPPLPPADLDVAPDPHFDLKEVSKTFRTQVHAELLQLFTAGSDGRTLVELYTGQIDRLISYLFAAATQLYARRNPQLHQRCAVFAVGGYGRRELNPYSDIDLLFLYNWKISPYVETVCETILLNLTDARFVTLPAVRNVRECVRLANQDLQVKTALLDARYLCGDELLARDFTTALEREIIGKHAERFFQDKARESQDRHQRYGGSIYLLEPYVKDGKGGLRDFHTALWLAKVKYKVHDLRELIAKGVISTSTLAEVEAARDFLWQVRNGLHLLERTEQDHLTFECQDRLAPLLKFADVTSFMRHYYHSATTIHAFSQTMLQRCLDRPRFYSFIGRPGGREIREGVRILDNTLIVTKAELFTRAPQNVISIFHDAQRHGVRLADTTRRLIREVLPSLPAEVAWMPPVRDAFFAILTWKQRVAHTLREMHTLGVLEWILPEFAHLRWRTQRDLYHIYAIDEHTLHGVAELERLRDGEYKTELPLLTQVMRDIDKVELLFLALLYHDVGKGYGCEHAERGAQMVLPAAARWQLTPDDTHEWHHLVRHHLLMSHIAQRRDLSDSTVITHFARTVGTPALLKKLYLLTFADMKAVGPKVWNPWKAGLLDELYLKTLERFETEELVEEDRDARLQRRKERIRQTLLAMAQPDAVSAFLLNMPDSYFLSTPEEAVPAHFQLLSRFAHRDGDSSSDPYCASLVHFPEREFSELTIVTHDRPGLFAMLTGVLAVQGLNVASARITTSREGIALDAFRLSHLDQQALVMEPDTWTRVYARLSAVLRGERKVEDIFRAARPPAFLRKPNPRVPTEVTVDNSVSPDYTVIDVTAPDRMGLLFTLTYSLFQFGVEIHLAKITTNVDQVLDVFYVTDRAGAKITDPDSLAKALRTQLLRMEGGA
jgi:[protein-PII] uridylyltransferase